MKTIRNLFAAAAMGASALVLSVQAQAADIVDTAVSAGSFKTLVAAVQAAGLRGLDEGQAIGYEVLMERGKPAAGNLKAI